jgi:hypothetical protein
MWAVERVPNNYSPYIAAEAPLIPKFADRMEIGPCLKMTVVGVERTLMIEPCFL